MDTKIILIVMSIQTASIKIKIAWVINNIFFDKKIQRNSMLQFLLAYIFISVMVNSLLAQPDYNSKKQISGVSIFRDSAEPHLYYYGPGKLRLSREKNGEPKFQFIDTRYTGTKCYNDQGEKTFLSLLQFGVEMETFTSQHLKKISDNLRISVSKLLPLPISHINSRLILPYIDDENHDIGKNGDLEPNGINGYSTNKAFWTKRTFLVKLNYHESQILKAQIENSLLGISLAYEYYADFKMNKVEEINGMELDRLSSSELNGKNEDRIIKNKLVVADAFHLAVDVAKYPEIIKQIDLNEEIPPAYANTEIRCYDFTNDLRPDLYMKIVEIEAESVNKRRKVTVETKFSMKSPDVNSKHISFPYAIYIDSPMRYRVTEINIDGSKQIFEWVVKPDCSSTIDVTAKGNQNGNW